MISQPFRHIVIDEFINPELCRAAVVEWPQLDWPHWFRYEGERGTKFVTRDASRLTPICSQIMGDLFRLPIGKMMEVFNGFPDTSLYGAGMSMILEGGDLPVHLDSDYNPITGWTRVASAMIYLSECEGGELQFWDSKGQELIKSIAPMPGRMVIFECTNTSWHSVNEVKQGKRLSLSCFFWKLSDSQGLRPRAEFLK